MGDVVIFLGVVGVACGFCTLLGTVDWLLRRAVDRNSRDFAALLGRRDA